MEISQNTKKSREEGTGWIGNKENWNAQNYNIVEINEKTEKSPRDGTGGIGNTTENRNDSYYNMVKINENIEKVLEMGHEELKIRRQIETIYIIKGLKWRRIRKRFLEKGLEG